MELTVSDWAQVLSTVLAAVAAVVAAISSWLSLRATKAVEAEAQLARAVTRFELVTSMEANYRTQYDGLMRDIATDAEKHAVDPALRKTVHDLLQSASLAYLAGELSLLADADQDYISTLFLDWLSYPAARDVWWTFFRPQTGVWPGGFVEFMDERVGTPPPTVPAP